MFTVCQDGMEIWATRSPATAEAAEVQAKYPPLSQNPGWIDLRDKIVNALRPFPDAWKAVLKAITPENEGPS